MSEEENEPSTSASFLGHDSVDDYIRNVMVSVRGCQRISAELQGWQHYKDYSAVQATMEQVNRRLTSLITSIFSHGDVKLKLAGHELSDQFEMLREGNDAFHERINSDIDEVSGLKKQSALEFVNNSIKTVKGPTGIGKQGGQMVLLASRNVQKPQLFFSEKVNNSKKEPFIPLLKEKPHSMKPLSMLISVDEMGRDFIEHPYIYELQHWTPPTTQLEVSKVTKPRDIEETPMVKVETAEALQTLLEKMKKCSEIAVDLEHHEFRTYQGLTCLMQISTRDEDFIVDTLALRGKMTILNEVFTDRKIIKVIHGSDSDIYWLQRDCGLYVVNMFDTHQAAVVLEYPHRSLAALLQHFCNIQANKVYQRADWRIRPLPIDFLDYARQDSHYLLYIYDMLRNELVEKGNQLNHLINVVYTRSTELCMKRYEKPYVGEDTYLGLYRRSRKSFNNRQISALQMIFIWRDNVARDHDESVDFVLPKHMMLQISEVLPKEMQGILACCNPIPSLVKTELLTLHNMIRSAREQPLNKVDTSQKLASLIPLETIDDQAAAILSKHDLSQIEENVTGLPCLLKPQETLFGNLFSQLEVIKPKKSSQLFGCAKKKLKVKKIDNCKTDEFMSPFERYNTYVYLKPILEVEKNSKPDAGDVARLNRVREHLKNVIKDPDSQRIDSTSEINNEDLSRIERVKHHLANFLKPPSPEPEQMSAEIRKDTVERVDRLRDHFLSIMSSLQSTPNESFSPLNILSTSSLPETPEQHPESFNNSTIQQQEDSSNKDKAVMKKEKKKEKLARYKARKNKQFILKDELAVVKKKKKRKIDNDDAASEIKTVSETKKKRKKIEAVEKSLVDNIQEEFSGIKCALKKEIDGSLDGNNDKTKELTVQEESVSNVVADNNKEPTDNVTNVKKRKSSQNKRMKKQKVEHNADDSELDLEIKDDSHVGSKNIEENITEDLIDKVPTTKKKKRKNIENKKKRELLKSDVEIKPDHLTEDDEEIIETVTKKKERKTQHNTKKTEVLETNELQQNNSMNVDEEIIENVANKKKKKSIKKLKKKEQKLEHDAANTQLKIEKQDRTITDNEETLNKQVKKKSPKKKKPKVLAKTDLDTEIQEEPINDNNLDSNKVTSDDKLTQADKDDVENIGSEEIDVDSNQNNEEMEPFDYSKADFSVFEAKKKIGKKSRKVHEKFKGATQKNRGMKKSGMKCFTWGSSSKKK